MFYEREEIPVYVASAMSVNFPSSVVFTVIYEWMDFVFTRVAGIAMGMECLYELL